MVRWINNESCKEVRYSHKSLIL